MNRYAISELCHPVTDVRPTCLARSLTRAAPEAPITNPSCQGRVLSCPSSPEIRAICWLHLAGRPAGQRGTACLIQNLPLRCRGTLKLDCSSRSSNTFVPYEYES